MPFVVPPRVGSAALCRRAAPFAALVLALATPRPCAAQEGEAWAAAVGSGLGLLSGAVLADVGAIVPCGQTRAGVRCVQVAVGFGGGVGLVSGAVAGYADAETVEHAALGAAIGGGIGLVAGLAVGPFVERFRWHDVVTLGLVGGAIGASMPGSAIGLGVGAVTGVALWRLTSTIGEGNAAGAALAGLAVGGVATWAFRALGGPDGPGVDGGIPIGVRISF